MDKVSCRMDAYWFKGLHKKMNMSLFDKLLWMDRHRYTEP